MPNWTIQTTGFKAAARAMKVFAEADAPYLRSALTEIGHMGRAAVVIEAPRHLVSSVMDMGVQGSGFNLKAVVVVDKADANRQEFGRKAMPYRARGSAKGRRATYNLKREGYVYKGSKARPYVGVIHKDHAIGAIKVEAAALLAKAIDQEYVRIATGGD